MKITDMASGYPKRLEPTGRKLENKTPDMRSSESEVHDLEPFKSQTAVLPEVQFSRDFF